LEIDLTHMAAQASLFHLQLEQGWPQAVQPLVDAARKRTWFFQGAGLATLMWIGVYSMGGLEFQHGPPSGPEQPSGHELAVAGFYGNMPVHNAGGLRQQQAKSPVFLPTRWVGSPSMNVPVHTGEGKGFGGGEATRDPEATYVDPNDPKGKQQAIHKAESFADYLAKRNGGAGAPAAAAPAAQPVAAAPYAAAAPVAAPAAYAATAAAPSGAFNIDNFGGIWSLEAKTAMFNQWDPESPRTYTNFNPFERNDESAQADIHGCFPGQSRGYQSPIRPETSWAIMEAERAKMDELKLLPKFNIKGRPGNFVRSWQDNLGPVP
jgi:hypothetical protein